jgi:hypothetical protein
MRMVLVLVALLLGIIVALIVFMLGDSSVAGDLMRAGIAFGGTVTLALLCMQAARLL